MGQTFSCSCDTSQDQEEVSLMQPVTKDGTTRAEFLAQNQMIGSPDDSEIMQDATQS
jgi:hypothetical protein